jgi:hypothetical protein
MLHPLLKVFALPNMVMVTVFWNFDITLISHVGIDNRSYLRLLLEAVMVSATI